MDAWSNSGDPHDVRWLAEQLRSRVHNAAHRAFPFVDYHLILDEIAVLFVKIDDRADVAMALWQPGSACAYPNIRVMFVAEVRQVFGAMAPMLKGWRIVEARPDIPIQAYVAAYQLGGLDAVDALEKKGGGV